MRQTMAQLPYHYGVKFRIFPSTEQKRLIKCNSDASRFIYNEMNGMNRELYQLKQVKIQIALVQQRIKTLKQRLKHPATGISNLHGWLNDQKLDSLMKANAIKNYHNAWKLFHKVHQAGTPAFHKRRTEQTYQTDCLYDKKVKTPNMLMGSVRLLDQRHIQVPKLGRLRFRGFPDKLLQNAQVIRIGTVTLSMDATGRYYVSLQLASEQPFVTTPKQATHGKIGIDLNLDNF